MFSFVQKKIQRKCKYYKCFFSKKGKVAGLVYGGNSRKIRNYLQLSNKLFITYNSRNENKLGYFKTELLKPISPMYFSDKERTAALISLCSILDNLLPESQPNLNIYYSLDEFMNSIKLDNWIFVYIFFELNLIRNLGYDPNLLQFQEENLKSSEIKKIKIDTYTYDVPYYLISQKLPEKISNELVKKSLYFTRHIIQNRFFIPNNIPFPKSRLLLEDYFI